MLVTDLIGKPNSIFKLRIDLTEIHYREIETGKFVNGEALTLFGARRAIGLPNLRAALLLQDPAYLALIAAISILAGDADPKYSV